MFPTMLGITLVTFAILQVLPGGPVEQALTKMRFGGQGGGDMAGASSSVDSQIDEEFVQALKEEYGFDKPIHVRYAKWLKDLVKLDLGESWYYDEPVLDVVTQRFPVSITFGIFSLFFTYLICVPLGILKSLTHNRFFDYASSVLVFFGYSIPGYALLILLIVLFCGGSYFDIFPMQGMTSENFDDLSFLGKTKDLIMHMTLPMTAYIVNQFAFTTMMMKNSMIEQITSDYVRTAYAKGLTSKMAIGKHALRNALIPIATGFGDFVAVFLASSLLIEKISGLDGIGLLTYDSLLNRDYPVVMGVIVLSSVAMMVGNLISDLSYTLIDPRIDFK